MAEGEASGDDGGEMLGGVFVGAAEGGDDGRLVGGEEGGEIGGQRLGSAAIEEREAGEAHLRRPIALRRRVPIGIQADDSLRGIPPIV